MRFQMIKVRVFWVIQWVYFICCHFRYFGFVIYTVRLLQLNCILKSLIRIAISLLICFRNCINWLTFHGFHRRHPVLCSVVCCNEVLVYTAQLLLYQSHRYDMFRPSTIRPSYHHILVWRAQYWNNQWFPTLLCKYRDSISVTVLGRTVGRERAALSKWLGPCARRDSWLTCKVCVCVCVCVCI